MDHGANGRSTSSATTCESSPTRADRPRSRRHERCGAPSHAQLRTPRNQREAAATGQGSQSRLIELRGGTAFRFGPTHLEEYFSSLGDGRRSKVVSDTVFAMVANRLIDPASKRRTITEWLASGRPPPRGNPPSLGPRPPAPPTQ